MLLIAIKYFVERKLAGRRAFDQTARELSATSDRELADMGLSRCDVRPIALRAGLDAEIKVRTREAEAAKAKAMARAKRGIGAPPAAYY